VAPADRTPRPWVEFALVMIVFFVAGGAPPPHVNETHYLAKAKHYWDPSYCPGDMFLDSADAHLAFYWTVGWLTKWLSLAAVAWVARVVAWMMLAWAWVRLVRTATSAPWVGAATALVWVVLLDRCDFAGEWVVGGHIGKGGVESKCFAYPLVFAGLAAIAAGRWSTPWIWFGAAAVMHALVGGWAVLAGLGVWLTEPRATRPRAVALLPGLALGGFLSLAGVIPAVALNRGVSQDTADEAARIYVFERLPHHLAPLALFPAEFAERSVRFSFVVVAMAGLALWLRGRALHQSSDADAVWRPASVGRIMRFAAMALIANCMAIGLQIVLAERPLVAARLLRYYWFRQADVMVPAAVAIGAACAALELARPAQVWIKPVVAITMLLCALHLMLIAADRWQRPYPPAIVRMRDPDAWIAACQWVREHTPRDALFIVPWNGQSFKWYAQRADVVNWKDVPQDAAALLEWRRRRDEMPTIEIDGQGRLVGDPERWSTARVTSIARRYGADFVIAYGSPPLGLRELYATSSDPESAGYAVYETGVERASEAAP
jgi:hypothetical protein